jgi:photosystem II stability/assembly factor-like uncharacterized protein
MPHWPPRPLVFFYPLLGIIIAFALSSCEDSCDCPSEQGCPSPTPCGWFPLASVPTKRHVNAVHAIDAMTVVAAGDSGMVLRTVDGGDTWSFIQTATNEGFIAMSFGSANWGWAIGTAGTLMRTTDGGLTWRAQDPGTTGDVRAVFFLSDAIGWIGCGAWPEGSSSGMLAYTEDGGETWVPRATEKQVNLVYAIDADIACASLSDGTVLRTTDRGQTWQESQSNPPSWVGGIWFRDSLIGVMCGAQGWAATTADGGMSWTPVTSGTTRNLVDLYFLQDEQTGWAVGAWGTILKTVDGGATWMFRTSDTTSHLRATSFADEQTGWIVGQNGTILKTVMGGDTN